MRRPRDRLAHHVWAAAEPIAPGTAATIATIALASLDRQSNCGPPPNLLLPLR
jgi:hypothetical protein